MTFNKQNFFNTLISKRAKKIIYYSKINLFFKSINLF